MHTHVCWLFFRGARTACCIGEHEGMHICDFVGDPDAQGAFLARAIEAINLIKDNDPVRFRRVRRHISLIGNVSAAHLTTLGGYDLSLHICYMRGDIFLCPDTYDVVQEHGPCAAEYAEQLAMVPAIDYAAMLIHEATHGAVEARGIGYCEENQLRIERLCLLEERRFVARHWPWFADWLPKEPEEPTSTNPRARSFR